MYRSVTIVSSVSNLSSGRLPGRTLLKTALWPILIRIRYYRCLGTIDILGHTV